MKRNSVCWNITSRCNENCRFCYRIMCTKENTYEQNDRILDLLIELKIDKITWTGGEALLYPHLFDLMKKAHYNNIKNNIIKQVNLPYRVFCVGRLDKESSGLIILTNDGVFANDLINADKNVEKEYIVTLEKPINQKLLESLKTPITIRNKITKETRVKIINNYSFQIILTDGKYHQIRRLVIRGENKVKTLKRIRIGKYKLNGLKENEILKFNGGNDEKI